MLRSMIDDNAILSKFQWLSLKCDLQKFKFPGKVQVIDFDTNEPDSMTMMVYALGSLKYTVNHKINRDTHKCDPNASLESFTKCAFSRFNHTRCTAIITEIGDSIAQFRF